MAEAQPVPAEDDDTDHLMSDSFYKWCKFTAQIGLPTLGTLYFTLAQIWGLPAAEEVSGTVLAVDTALGALLHFGEKSYDESGEKFDGTLLIKNAQGQALPHLALSEIKDPSIIAGKDQVTFRVNADNPPQEVPPVEEH